MSSELNKSGLRLPKKGDQVRYQPEDGSEPNVAIVTAVNATSELMVQLTIFWRHLQSPDGVPSSGWYGYRRQGVESSGGTGTWHWEEPEAVPDVFAELPDLSEDPAARAQRIEELGG